MNMINCKVVSLKDKQRGFVILSQIQDIVSLLIYLLFSPPQKDASFFSSPSIIRLDSYHNNVNIALVAATDGPVIFMIAPDHTYITYITTSSTLVTFLVLHTCDISVITEFLHISLVIISLNITHITV